MWNAARVTGADQAARAAQPLLDPRVRGRGAAPSTAVIVTALTVGLMLLAAFVTVVTVVGDRNDTLRRHGAQVSGTVTRLTPDSGWRSGRVWVRYPVGGRTLVGSVDAGSDVAGFRVGEAVRVYYDPRDPGRMTVQGEDNQAAWSVDVTLLLVAFGVVALGLGLAGVAVRLRRRWWPASRDRLTRRSGRHSSEAVTLGRSWLMVVLGVGGVALTAALTVAGARSDTVSLGSAAGDGAFLGAGTAFFFLLAGTRVTIDRAATLRVVNAVTVTVIPAGAVASLDAVNGLQVRLHGGRRIGSAAFGGSLAGQLLGQQRAHAVVDRWHAWLQAHPPAAPGPTHPAVRRRLRPALLCAPAWVIGYTLAAAGAHTLTH